MIHVLLPSGEAYSLDVREGVTLDSLTPRLGGGLILFYDGEEQLSRQSRVVDGQFIRVVFQHQPSMFILFQERGRLWYTDIHHTHAKREWNPDAVELEEAIVYIDRHSVREEIPRSARFQLR
jgi:hypothetical protein